MAMDDYGADGAQPQPGPATPAGAPAEQHAPTMPVEEAMAVLQQYGITDPAVMKKIDAALDSLEMAGILPPDEHEQAPAKPDAKLDGMISGAMTKAGM